MYDSTDVAAFPRRAKMAAAYVDGLYVTYDELCRHRPDLRRIVMISVNGSKAADVIDRETGDVSAARAAELVDQAVVHSIYVNLASLGEVLRALAHHNLQHTPIWTAHWTGRKHICGANCLKPYRLPYAPNVVATQYADPKTSGGHYDVSLVAAHWPGVDLETPAKGLTAAQRAAVTRVRRIVQRRAKSGVPLPWSSVVLLQGLRHDIDAAIGHRRP